MQADIEVERLHALKSSKMKELVIKKRLDLEEICRHAHLEPDSNTTEDQLIALIDSGITEESKEMRPNSLFHCVQEIQHGVEM